MERREGEVQLASGDWMREIVTAALNEDLDTLIRFQKATIDADDSVVRIEKIEQRCGNMPSVTLHDTIECLGKS